MKRIVTNFNDFIIENNDDFRVEINIPETFKDGWDYLYGSLIYKNEKIGKFEIEIKFEDSNHDDEDNQFSIYDDNYDINIYGFYIEEGYRGSGMGEKFFKEIIMTIDKKLSYHDNIYLSVFSDNIPAINIYIKSGFEIIRKEENGKILIFERRNKK
jgi:ribosomal protein S18 acetylase RimI-like enzyme